MSNLRSKNEDTGVKMDSNDQIVEIHHFSKILFIYLVLVLSWISNGHGKKSSMTFILNYIASSEQTKYELMRNKNVTLDFLNSRHLHLQ